MKKLFFAAALAIVAIGGAVSSATAVTYFSANGTQSFPCPGGNTSCGVLIGSTSPVYLINDPIEANQGPAISPDEYNEELFQN